MAILWAAIMGQDGFVLGCEQVANNCVSAVI